MAKIGVIDGHLVREKSDGSSGYWRVFRKNAWCDLWNQGGFSATSMSPTATRLGGLWYTGTGYTYGTIFYIGDDWDGTTDIVVDIEFEAGSAAVGSGNVVCPVSCFVKNNGTTTGAEITVSDATAVIGNPGQYHKDVASTTVSSSDVSAGDFLRFEFDFNPTSSDITSIVINTVVIKYKTKYPAQEVQ